MADAVILRGCLRQSDPLGFRNSGIPGHGPACQHATVRAAVAICLSASSLSGSKIVLFKHGPPGVRLGNRGFGGYGSFAVCAFALTARILPGRAPRSEVHGAG